jgi:hypothetical protein
VLCFIRDPFSFRLGCFSLLAFENFQQVQSRRSAHLFEPFHRYDGGKGFTLALDNKLVVAKRHPVQDVAESLANFQSGNFLCHGSTIIVALVAYVKYMVRRVLRQLLRSAKSNVWGGVTPEDHESRGFILHPLSLILYPFNYAHASRLFILTERYQDDIKTL